MSILFYHRESTKTFRERFTRLYGQNAELCLRRLKMMIGRYGVGFYPEQAKKWDQKTSVLITYADMVQSPASSPLATLKHFLDTYLTDVFSTVHILPFFPYSSDDGFSVTNYLEIKPEFGQWSDIDAIGKNFSLMFDLVLNHCSRDCKWFEQFTTGILPGRKYFITCDPETDLSQVARPRSHPLLTEVNTRYGPQHVWTTFSADQVDLDFKNPDVLFEFLNIMFFYISKGARIIRLDAIAYLWKQLGTNCINLPETHEMVKLLRYVVEMVAPGVLILTETNIPHKENVAYFGDGDEANIVYQFALPPLVLHALQTGNAKHLTAWAMNLTPPPAGCTYLNFTASHDGIGVRPLEGLLPKHEIDSLVKNTEQRGGMVSRKDNGDGTLSPYELNVTYFDALCENCGKPTELDIRRFLCSQAIPLTLQGIPAVYFHSLTGARNHYEGVREQNVARAINRQKMKLDILERRINDPALHSSKVFEEYTKMLEIRGEHPAFSPDAEQKIFNLDPRVFVVGRSSIDDGEMILAIFNLTAERFHLDIFGVGGFTSSRCVDLLTKREFPERRVELKPYQFRWLKLLDAAGLHERD